MDRTTVVSMSVLFAVSLLAAACDSKSGGDQKASSADQQASSTEQKGLDQPTDAGDHRTRTGLEFETPSDWSTKLMPAGAQLIPPTGPDSRDSYLLVIRFAPDDTDSAADGQYIDALAEDFTERIDGATIATRETGFDNPMGSASYVAWDIQKNGWVKRVGFFVTISPPWMLVLRATGPRKLVEKRRETLASIFASAELTPADIDRQLVGTWRRTEPVETDKGSFRQTMTLEEDGTLRLTHMPAGDTDLEPPEDIGRWAANDEKLIQYVGNHLQGGVQLETHAWNIDENDDELILDSQGSKSTWRRVP